MIVFGVSGAGKTTIGKRLAGELGWKFYEGDDFHPAANIEKMRSGHPLTDEDRKPWLAKLRKLIERETSSKRNAVVACSALKRKYRDYLRVGPEVRFVFLRGDRKLIEKQLKQRRGHFMDPHLLDSQFRDLEEPQPDEGTIVIELGRSPADLVKEIRTKLFAKSSEHFQG